jgi:hypothetical protein
MTDPRTSQRCTNGCGNTLRSRADIDTDARNDTKESNALHEATIVPESMARAAELLSAALGRDMELNSDLCKSCAMKRAQAIQAAAQAD